MPRPASTESEVDGRSTRWDAHNAQRRLDVLDAAIEVIEEDGPSVGVKRIAERVGLPRPVVYRHFKDRADLDEQIRRRIVESLMAELAPTLRPDGTVMAAIRRSIGTYLGWIELHPRLYAFLGANVRASTGGSRAVSDTKAEIAMQVSEIFTRVLDSHDRDTDLARSMAAGLVGLVDATVNRWLSNERDTLSTTRLADFLARSIWAVLDSNLHALEVEIGPEDHISTLFGDEVATTS